MGVFKNRGIFFSFIFFLAAANPPAQAGEAQLMGLIQQLQQQMTRLEQTIEAQNQKIAVLEQRSAVIPGENAGAGGVRVLSQEQFDQQLGQALGGANKWLKDLTFKGDLRLRTEFQQFTSGDPAETDDRNRFRYRLRFGWEKKFSDEIKAGFSLSSGEPVNGLHGDPAAPNTSFDNLFNYKEIYISRAYASYAPKFAAIGPVENLNFTGGKFDNPFERGSSEMVWDRDVKPEGLAETLDVRIFDGEKTDVKTFFTAGQLVLDEDAASGGDAELFAYQLGLQSSWQTPFFASPVEHLSAVSFYNYSDFAVGSNFFLSGASLARGNSNFAGPATELDAEDFEVWEYYTEVLLPFGRLPVRPFADVAHNPANQAVGDEDLAWALGAKVGKAEKKGQWEVQYAYRRVEPESVAGVFADSDFGLGNAGKRGSILKFAYGVTDNIFLNASACLVNNLTTGTGAVRDEEQRRFQFDLLWKF